MGTIDLYFGGDIMNWNDVEKPWQVSFEQGWKAFKKGSIPIGAVIIDEKSNIISMGRNKIYEYETLNPKIAHAEMECLLNLDILKHPNVREYTLYTCMEPCPMCFGTIVMSNIRKVKIASRDSYCGAAHYCEDDTYIASKNMQVSFERGILESVQLVLQSYFEIRACNGEMNRVVQAFQKESPLAVKIAEEFFGDRYLDVCSKNGIDISEVFKTIVSRL